MCESVKGLPDFFFSIIQCLVPAAAEAIVGQHLVVQAQPRGKGNGRTHTMMVTFVDLASAAVSSLACARFSAAACTFFPMTVKVL